MSGKTGARISGLGLNVPSKILTNADLERIVETSDEWITTRTGIKERRIAEEGVTASTLGAPAAIEAIKKAGLEASDIGLIICATATPDMRFPSTACLIQKIIGAQPCAAFDITAVCSGFVYGITIAEKFIAQGTVKHALVVGVEILSRMLDWEDRATCVLFGDGSGAAVLSATDDDARIIDSQIKANGDYGDFLMAGVGSDALLDSPSPPGKEHFVKMKGNQTFKVAVKTMSEAAAELLAAHGYTANDIDLVVPHQANIRIINAVGKSLGVDEKKVFINVQKYGNTSAATIPMALYEAEAEGRLKAGSLVLLVAFGGGFTWGATLIRW